jgi:hypothetical protein
MSAGIADGIGIHNNTNKGIPIDLIKKGYFTNVKNEDGTRLLVDKQRSSVYDVYKNYIAFDACDKIQTVNTYLELILINDTILRTTSVIEVIVK